MTLDPYTLLMVSILAASLMAGAYVVVWLQDRRETAILWMVAATLLCCANGILRELLTGAFAIVVANAALLIGLSCIGTCCRVLAGRAPSVPGLLGAAGLWAAACAVPAILGDQGLRVVLASTISGLLMAWAMAELWHGQREAPIARIGLTIVLAVNGLAAFGRAAAAVLAHASAQPGIMKGADVAVVTLWALGFILLAGFGVILIVKERAEHRFRHAADEDGLTGLANRRRFDAAFETAFRRASRTGRPLSLLMIDVDAFKAYNDACGHPAGDRSLRAVADLLAAGAKVARGLPARYGGEEFAVLLPDHDPAAALMAADAMRRSVRSLALPHPTSEHGRLTISIGIATTTPGAETEASDLLRAADRSLYAAKRAGRDRVEREIRGGVERAAA